MGNLREKAGEEAQDDADDGRHAALRANHSLNRSMAMPES